MPTPLDPRRRLWLQAGAAAFAAPALRLSFAADAATDAPKLVLAILRGGLDGLAAVPPVGDPALASARAPLVPAGALPLDGGLFALHPALVQTHAMVGRGEALVVHAAGLPYRERSHFDAQNLLESGAERPFALDTGWLGRALAALPGAGHAGLALQPATPLLLRGHAAVDTWAPSRLPEPGTDLVERLHRLYAGDPPLAAALARAQALRDGGMAPQADMAGAGGGYGAGLAAALARQAAGFLARPGGPQVAMLEMGGWDTHAAQGAETGQLASNLKRLDEALAALRDGLVTPEAGDAWRRTVVLVVTEFGRTVAVNGTQGSDHGSASAAFVLGGAVAGGSVLADWPGLAPAQRLEGRDLRPTTDLRAVFATVLQQHLGVPRDALTSRVLPGSGGLALLPILKG